MSYRSTLEFPENICCDPPNFHVSKPQPLIWYAVWGSPSHMSSVRDFQIILSHLHPRVCQCFSTFLFSLSTLIRKLLRNCFSHHTPYEILVPQIYLFMYSCTLYRKAKASFFVLAAQDQFSPFWRQYSLPHIENVCPELPSVMWRRATQI